MCVRLQFPVDSLSYVVCSLAILGCLNCGSAEPDGRPFVVDPVGCPASSSSSSGKIFHEKYVHDHPDLRHSVSIELNTPAWDLSACGGASGPHDSCGPLDAALAERQALNAQEVGCVVAALGDGIQGQPEWYEEPRYLSSGKPAPIGTAFQTRLLASQVDAIAKHPYVRAILPAFGEAARAGVRPPPIPEECPIERDRPDDKVSEAQTIQGQGRVPVVIELRVELLPPLVTCGSSVICPELIDSGWSRTILGQRMLTCVRRFIDSKLQGYAPAVNFQQVEGVPSEAAALPPFGALLQVQTAFALGLTWAEVVEAARHPYVRRIWTSPAVSSIEMPPDDACPPRYSEPVQTPECPLPSGDPVGKFSSQSMTVWSRSSGQNDVIVAVRRDVALCPRPVCPVRGVECPEQVMYDTRVNEETRVSQRCVRSLIEAVGGHASSEVFVFGNSFPASLTWAQIQVVAAHPDVIRVDRADDGTPPP